jgi:hypothetical protein
VDGVHPLERAHLSAMMRAVRCAPAHAPPALAHMRALRSPPMDSADASADDWLWCEIKLSRDVRARAPRERAPHARLCRRAAGDGMSDALFVLAPHRRCTTHAALCCNMRARPRPFKRTSICTWWRATSRTRSKLKKRCGASF